jgi:hypothetical protein
MVKARITRVSLGSAMASGAIGGLVFGLFLGALLGALASWFAGAVLDWERQLGFSLGVAQQLLPFGDQISGLEPVADLWYVVVPAGALIVGLLAAMVGGLAGGLWAALVNRGLTSIEVTVAAEEAPAHRAIVRSLPDRRVKPRRRAIGR